MQRVFVCVMETASNGCFSLDSRLYSGPGHPSVHPSFPLSTSLLWGSSSLWMHKLQLSLLSHTASRRRSLTHLKSHSVLLLFVCLFFCQATCGTVSWGAGPQGGGGLALCSPSVLWIHSLVAIRKVSQLPRCRVVGLNDAATQTQQLIMAGGGALCWLERRWWRNPHWHRLEHIAGAGGGASFSFRSTIIKHWSKYF